MPVLVSDANIFIDLEEGDILASAFQLPERIEVPDLLFNDELAEHHLDLIDRGLHLGRLDEAGINDLLVLASRYQRISRYDCAALALARAYGCTLVTGDAGLREAAMAEDVAVHGTIWLVERMLDEGLITTIEAKTAFQRMKDAGRRLPWADADAMVHSHRG